jgi:hypothetical protein
MVENPAKGHCVEDTTPHRPRRFVSAARDHIVRKGCVGRMKHVDSGKSGGAKLLNVPW